MLLHYVLILFSCLHELSEYIIIFAIKVHLFKEFCYEISSSLYSDAFADYFFAFQRAVSLAEATET
jgi:hypothetical protein